MEKVKECECGFCLHFEKKCPCKRKELLDRAFRMAEYDDRETVIPTNKIQDILTPKQ